MSEALEATQDKVIAWLFSGDAGTSSKTICRVMIGQALPEKSMGVDVPLDPSDFGRCYRLLKKFPEWRKRLDEVAGKYPHWKPFVRDWDALTSLYEEESTNRDGRAPRLYAKITELLVEGGRRRGS